VYNGWKTYSGGKIKQEKRIQGKTNMTDPKTLFDVQGSTAVITGGSGVLGSVMALALAKAGVRVAILSLHAASSAKVVEAIQAENGEAIGIACDVLERTELEHACTEVLKTFGPIDILINAAGGNSAQATTSADISFFDLDVRAIESVLDLNFIGTLQSCQVFGRGMAERGQGCIVNVASMNALRPLTRVPAYSAAKAAVANFTQWLAVHMAQQYRAQIRVNAIAPGFFLTEQNRFLLTDAQSGALTERGQGIIAHTPAGRLGTPEDLIGTLLWLVSPASVFVTGVVVPVDGGFSSFSGV
jgi:NAD(P)-dependent dehydrogenase (short-subunit alcohol dehydrogenase family)